ncbi:MAG TPA: class I SAM-dependent methyltransferase family protein [Candidatus Thermoplasmatota archaeon]|nr:class I SAM-dependent methyltransferase family protein [Candidatus Thermoplasmatota archaeon]
MVEAPGIRVPREEAETTRRRLLELEVLRLDLAVAKEGTDVVFPVADGCGPTLPTVAHDFEPRVLRPTGYQELLGWPSDRLALAPRAFDQVGDIVVVKVPHELADHAEELGDALLRFHKARAVFHDGGVKDPYRVRDLLLIAGEGDALTQVNENGVRLWVDLSKAYYSPRLASERERVADQVQPGERVVDLFGGVAPFGVQAAKRGATVDSVDLNPDAVALARRNVEENGVEGQVRLWEGDAREVARQLPLASADRVTMNLPHGAKHFLDVAARVAKPGATIHYHEIIELAKAQLRASVVLRELGRCGWMGRLRAHRVVRNYSPQESHIVFDLEGVPG